MPTVSRDILQRRLGLGATGSGRRSPTTLPELQFREAELEQENRLIGAESFGPEEDQPGFFRSVLEVLGAPGFAIAGLTEELFSGGGFGRATGRLFRELFDGVSSGIRLASFGNLDLAKSLGIQGEQRAFGEVFERLGVGTITLGEMIPALEKTWIGGLGLRGAVGLTFDIFADPLTYVTFGLGSGARVTTRAGLRALNKPGRKVLGDLRTAAREKVGALERIPKNRRGDLDFLTRNEAKIQEAEEVALNQLEDLLEKGSGELLDPGGIKIFGRHLKRTTNLARGFQKGVVDTARQFKFGAAALDAANDGAQSVARQARGLFHPFARLIELPDKFRRGAIFLHRDFKNGSAVAKLRYGNRIANMKAVTIFKRLQKEEGQEAAEAFARRLADAREGTLKPKSLARKGPLEGEEQEALEEMGSLLDELFDREVDMGVLDDDRLIENYFMHYYTNDADEFATVWAGYRGNSPTIHAKHSKDRNFGTLVDAEEISKRLRQITKDLRANGKNVPLYPILKPNMNLEDILIRRVNWHTDQIHQKLWIERVTAKFGTRVDDFDINGVYNLSTPNRELAEREILALDRAFGDTTVTIGSSEVESFESTFKFDAVRDGSRQAEIPLTESFIEENLKGSVSRLTGQNVDHTVRPFSADPKDIARVDAEIASLSPAGRTEFFRRAFTDIHSPAQFAELTRRWEKYEDYFPHPRTNLEGTVEQGLSMSSFSILARHDEEAADRVLRVYQSIHRQIGEVSEAGKAAAALPGRRGVDLTQEALKSDAERRALAELVASGKEPNGFTRAFVEDPNLVYTTRIGGLWGDKLTMLPKIMADDIENVGSSLLNTADYGAFKKALAGWDWLNNWFKTAVYTIWPASLVRDAYSNLFLAGLDITWGAINPAIHKEAIAVSSVLRRRAIGKTSSNEVLQTIINVGDREMTIGQLANIIEEKGVALTGKQFIEYTGDKFIIHAGDASTFKSGAAKLLELRAQVENEARIMLFMNRMRRGDGIDDAANTVGEFLFNYNEVSAATRELVSRAVPFVRFAQKNLVRQAKSLAKTPGRVLNQVKPFRGRESENDTMVKFQAEGLKIRLNRDGKGLTILNGIDLPIRATDVLWRGSLSGTWRAQWGMITPIIKVPLEVALQRDFFTGRALDRTYSNSVGLFMETFPTPKSVKNWMGYKKETDSAGRSAFSFDAPRFNLLFRSWVFSRLISTSDRQFREYLKDGDIAGSLVDMFTGIRKEDMNLDEKQAQKIRVRIKQLEEAGVRRGPRRTFTRTFTPSERLGEETEFE